ncbi:MAG TPA: metallophosphoesterase [Thermoanaerobaculia bacterium]
MADLRSCPPTPKSDKPEDLGFEPQSMVDWLAPAQLMATGLKSVLSGIFGAYADKREVMAALHPVPDFKKDEEDYGDREEIWVDYIADLGDGFDATYTMGRLVAQETLSLSDGATTYETRRGKILVMGGDQVYPTASFQEYWNRLLQPYTAALPCVQGDEPRLFVVPGNHDWYDGLSNFTRIFCQRRWIGGWKTLQRRSYFALKLPHRWWLWGIDIQLEGYIDQAQIDFFRAHAGKMEEGDKVIVCTAQPDWVYAVTKGPDAFRSLGFLEDKTIRKDCKSDPRVILTGDLHHYVRYESADGSVQRITAGGGGAYLYATHQMPEEIDLQEGFRETARTVKYKNKKAFPDEATSSRIAFGTLRLPWRSWRFGLFLAVLYSLYAWVVQSASKVRPELFADLPADKKSLLGFLSGLTPSLESCWDFLKMFIKVLAHSPASVVFTAVIIGALYAFCDAKRPAAKAAIGIAHGLAHVFLNLALMWTFAVINVHRLEMGIDRPLQVLLFIAEMLVIGGFLGGVLMALYFLLCSVLARMHTNEVFSSQRIADYKNFLRLHIDATGRLTIYPVGVREVCKKWKLNPAAQNGQPWFDPDGCKIQAELIEKPIQVS